MSRDDRVNRMPYADLDWNDYVVFYEGTPYTGSGYDERPNGSLWSDEHYTVGIQDGPSRSWDDTGNLSGESNFKMGLLHGPQREWYPNGKLQIESIYELGTCIIRKRWNEHGDLIEHYAIDQNDVEYSLLETKRSNEEKRVQALRDKIMGKRPR